MVKIGPQICHVDTCVNPACNREAGCQRAKFEPKTGLFPIKISNLTGHPMPVAYLEKDIANVVNDLERDFNRLKHMDNYGDAGEWMPSAMRAMRFLLNERENLYQIVRFKDA